MSYLHVLATARIWQTSPSEDVAVAAAIVLSVPWLQGDGQPETDKVHRSGVTFDTCEGPPDLHLIDLYARTRRDPAFGVEALLHIKICIVSGWWPDPADESMSDSHRREVQDLYTEIARTTEYLNSLGIRTG